MLRRLVACLFVTTVATVACSGESEPPRVRDTDGFQQRASTAPELPTTQAQTPPPATCAATSAVADPLPLHLVIALDKSGSMCEYTEGSSPRDCTHPDSKWMKMRLALNSFFQSPASRGIMISLVAFPKGDSCSSSDYATPIVSGVGLPDATRLSDALKAMSGSGSTPTRPALRGALQYAKSLQAGAGFTGRVAVILASDGYPQGCDDNNIAGASQDARAISSTIPTFVIGVGSRLSDLNQLAVGGGTGSAILVDTNSAQASNALVAAFNKIRAQAFTCEYRIPAAPAGQRLDYQAVNVQLTTAGKASSLGYDEGCKGPGWRYDDKTKPSKILLCPASCDQAKASDAAKVEVLLGCATTVSGAAR